MINAPENRSSIVPKESDIDVIGTFQKFKPPNKNIHIHYNICGGAVWQSFKYRL